MTLQSVAPLRFKGVKSDWLSTLPNSGTEMLTISSTGVVSRQAIPSASFGALTGLPSDNAALQSALDAKLNLSGGTLTGQLNGTTAVFSSSVQAGAISGTTITTSGVNVADLTTYATLGPFISILHYGRNFAGLNGNIYFGAGQFGSGSIFTSGTGSTNGALHISSLNTSFVNPGAYLGWRSSLVDPSSSGWDSEDLRLYRDAANTIGQRNGTNAQRYNLYGTYTDASNYRRFNIASTTAGAFTLSVGGAGTGASGNTLAVYCDDVIMRRNTGGVLGKVLSYAGADNVNLSAVGGGGVSINNNATEASIGNSMVFINSAAMQCFGDIQVSTVNKNINFPNLATLTNSGSTNRHLIGTTNFDNSLLFGSRGGARFWVGGGTGGSTGFEAFSVSSSGNVGIGQTSPSVGLVIRRSGTDLPSMRLEDGDITIPMTGLSINPSLNANTVSAWSAAGSATGGAQMNGFTNNTASAIPMSILGYSGSTTPTAPCIGFIGNKSNGGTGVADLSGTELIAGFYPGNNAVSPVMTIAANGTIAASSLSLTGTLTHGFQTLVANPSTVDITTGLSRMVKNSTSGDLRFWANDGGSMKSVLLS